MKSLAHLTGEKVEALCIQLWAIRGSLKGMGALLEQQCHDPCYEGDEMFGLGQLCKLLSDQLDRIEDILRCGYDSRAAQEDEEEDANETEEVEMDDET